jgi:hypothetical protein
MADLLRAFPSSPGSTKWVVQNLSKTTEYEVETEGWWCPCPQWEFKKKCKHIDHLAEKFKRRRAKNEPRLITTLRAEVRAEHGVLSAGEEFDLVMIKAHARLADEAKAQQRKAA